MRSIPPSNSMRSRPPMRGGAVRRLLTAGAFALAALPVLGGLVVEESGMGEMRMMEVASSTSGWLHTDGGMIRDAANNPYIIKSISWFGLETPECVPHGLWTINLDKGIQQIKDMGFNTIRLPYSNECITTGETSSVDYSANPGLVGKAPLHVMDAVIAAAKANGLNVILDRHRPDSGSQSELWYTARYSEEKWIADWTMLAARYKDNPTVIGADLHNEPRGAACWGCENPATDWQAAATRAGNSILSINPNLLIIVEGIENESDGTATWWGSGLKGVAAYPIRLDIDNRVVYSPHDYPGSVYPQKWFSEPDYPANLPNVWDKNWGYIAKQGIAPVLLGEFGTRLETTSDKQWLDQMVKYLGSTGISYSYWSYNPNSGDTGGLVQDDWRTPETTKLEALKPLLTTTPVPVQPPPAVVTPEILTTSIPTISGTNKVGYTLTANPRTWTTGTRLTYQWYRSGIIISGATGSTYSITPADLGKNMKVHLRGTKTGYDSASRISAQTASVIAGTLMAPAPTISGTNKVGYTLTANPRTWTTGTRLTYQWYRSGLPIKGAASKLYKLVSADRGSTVKVRVVGSRTGYSTVPKYSLPTVRISSS